MTLIKSAVDALKAMAPDSSWLTIFNRESQQAEIGRFQIGLAEIGEESDVYVSMLACLIQAKSSITQVLLFKFRAEHVAFKANSAKLSIDSSSLLEIQPAIRAKIRAYRRTTSAASRTSEINAAQPLRDHHKDTIAIARTRHTDRPRETQTNRSTPRSSHLA